MSENLLNRSESYSCEVEKEAQYLEKFLYL